MFLSTLKPVTCRIPPVTGDNGSPSKVSKLTMVNRQARPCPRGEKKEKLLLHESSATTTRREMMHLTAASVGVLSLLLPASAEASPRNATMRQKIMEKLEELKQKAVLSKPKEEDQNKKPKDEGEGKSKQEDGSKETKRNAKDEKNHSASPQESPAPSTEEPSVPALPSIINSKTVETTLK